MRYHYYADQDILGQAAMTEAMFDWLEDDAKVHLLNIQVALTDFNIILGLYMSALNREVVSLPVQPQPALNSSSARSIGET